MYTLTLMDACRVKMKVKVVPMGRQQCKQASDTHTGNNNYTYCQLNDFLHQRLPESCHVTLLYFLFTGFVFSDILALDCLGTQH